MVASPRVDLVRRHWLLAASLGLLLAELCVPAVWRTYVEANTRSGQSSSLSLGERGLWIAGVGLGLYLAAGLGVPRHWAMRPPTDGEVAVARWFVRALGVLAILGAVVVTFPW